MPHTLILPTQGLFNKIKLHLHVGFKEATVRVQNPRYKNISAQIRIFMSC